MAESPMVERFKHYFKKTSLDKKIDRVVSKNDKLLVGGSVDEISKILKGKTFKDARRRGKFLIADTSSDYKVIFHFGLTGSLFYKKAEDKKGKAYTRIIFVFENGDELEWANKEGFGRVYVIQDPLEVKTLSTMGPEAVEITPKEFDALLKEKDRSNVKTFLMDQKIVAGIGNLYANEILFQAGIHPTKKISELTVAERKTLYKAMRGVLKKAMGLKVVEGEDIYHKGRLLGRRSMVCTKNPQHELKKIRIGGRITVFCPEHQKK